MNKRSPTKDRLRFTLTEMLIVISVLAILVALLVPCLRNALTKAKVMSCTANLKSTAVGFSLYAEDSDNYLPVGLLGGLNWMDQIHNYLVSDPSLMLAESEKQGYTISLNKGLEILFCPSETRSYKSFLSGSWHPCFTYVMPVKNNAWPSRYIGVANSGTTAVPHNLNRLVSPYGIAMLTETAQSESANSPMGVNQGGFWAGTVQVPQNPETMALHDFSINYLFVDGHTSNMFVFDPTQWGTGTIGNPNGIYSVQYGD